MTPDGAIWLHLAAFGRRIPVRRRREIRLQLRLYPGRDDDLIRWLARFDGRPYGAKSQAVKEALRRGIGSGPGQPASGPALDLAEIRAVVEAAVEQALARFEGQVSMAPAVPPEADEEVEALLDGLEASLVLEDEG